MSEPDPPGGFGEPDPHGAATLHVELAEVVLEENGARSWVPIDEYQSGEPDPLHLGAAEQLQHLLAHHPEAIEVLSRLCDSESLTGAIRVLPIALDRYGIVLRVERLRDHRDVRLPFRCRVGGGAEAAAEMRQLLALGQRRRPCGR
jgi:hypothetical protein